MRTKERGRGERGMRKGLQGGKRVWVLARKGESKREEDERVVLQGEIRE